MQWRKSTVRREAMKGVWDKMICHQNLDEGEGRAEGTARPWVQRPWGGSMPAEYGGWCSLTQSKVRIIRGFWTRENIICLISDPRDDSSRSQLYLESYNLYSSQLERNCFECHWRPGSCLSQLPSPSLLCAARRCPAFPPPPSAFIPT